ncbi:sugar-binding protein [Metabacillus niabensis]|uniref:sugar-binding protein n=1 Tax=Metabacillus niabensis TaxID=324854 RepID=UPI0039A16638
MDYSMRYLRRFLYFSTFLVFIFTSILTLYYGKETFHFETGTVPTQAQGTVPNTHHNNYQHHFVLIPEELDNDYWRLVEQGARDAAKFHNVYLEYLGPKQANTAEHLKTIDMAIAGRVDGIITQGIGEEQFNHLVTKAKEKSIPIVTIDTDAPESERAVYVGTDNYYSGFIAGKAIINDTTGRQHVAIVTGRHDAPHQKLRVQGFMDAIATEKRISVLTVEESNITEIGASEAAHKILKQYPSVTAFYGTSALDGIGIAKVVSNLKAEDNIYIIGFDILSETLEYIENGLIEATVVQFPYQMGYESVERLIQLNEGKELQPLQHTDTKIVHKEDLPLDPATMSGGQQP